MIKLLVNISIRFTICWLLFFQLCRMLFSFFHWDSIGNLTWKELGLAFVYGMRMDLSATAYLFLLFFILILIQVFIRSTILTKVAKYYNFFWLLAVTVIVVSDAQLYKEWGVKIGKDAILLLKSPNEVMASVSSSPLLSLFLIGLCLWLMGILLYHFLVHPVFLRLAEPSFFDKGRFCLPQYVGFIVSAIFISGITVLAIRGGTQLATMNPSFAYYSPYNILNHTALNAPWHLMYSLAEKLPDKNPYVYVNEKELEQYSNFLEKNNNTLPDSLLILKSKIERPNIIIIVLESFTADIVGKLGGMGEVTPQLDTLANKGIWFENFYASGERTYKSLPAIFSAFPSLPKVKTIKLDTRFKFLPSISRTLKETGNYHTSFYYGGEMEFANMRAYVSSCGFERMIDQYAFSPKDRNSKWGVHDHIVLERIIEDMNEQPKPFFTTVLTLSSHEPFEIPIPKHFNNDEQSEATKFNNAAFYTDQSLGEFIEQAKQTDWFENTLFVITADHGHRLPKNRTEGYAIERYHIPLIFYGEVLKDKWKGKSFKRFTGQTDIIALILAQLEYEHRSFKWSKNIWIPQQADFAFYTYNDGFAWIQKDGLNGF